MASHIVIGPPGCGKTTYLTRQAARAAQRGAADGIIIASLTKAAAHEIGSRAHGIPQRNISTLHSHAYHRLRLRSEQMAQDPKALAEWNKQCPPKWKLTGQPTHRLEDAPLQANTSTGLGDQLYAEIEILRSKMIPPELWKASLQGFWASWTHWKIQTLRVDYTDMIEQALEHANLGAHTLFIDEAQDMSKLEMALIRKWADEAETLVIAGDPDQAIYQFRGADPTVMHSLDVDTKRTLSQSYRVPEAVHHKATAWIANDPNHVPAEYNPTQEAGLVQRHSSSLEHPHGVAALIEQLAEDGSTVMILTSCTYMLTPLLAALRKRALPFHNPYRKTQGAWNPLPPPDKSRLLAYLRMREDAWGDQARIWTWRELQRWTEPLNAKGVMHRGRKDWIKGKATGDTDDDPSSPASLASILECFHEAHHAAIFKGDEHWWLQNLRRADRKRHEYGVRLASTRGARVLHQEPTIIVGTMHSAKGGEADKVVLAPDLSRKAMKEWVAGRRGPIIRQFYVGMTRARHELHTLSATGEMRVRI